LAKAIRKAILDPTYASLVEGKVVLVSALQDYPQKYNIPAGAVSTAFADGAFGGSGAHAYGDLDPDALTKYVYPAELWYTANTKIKTANASKASTYESASYWKDVLDAYGAGEGTVGANTKSIALIDTIQYAVARLDVNVKIAAGDIHDNNPVPGSPAIAIPVGGYPLKAVLVGGQRNVGFNFTPLGGSDVYTIYDTVMTSAIAAQQDAGSLFNSTLVLETAADDGNHGSDIPVALEFINKGGDFYGIGNQLIPSGARFYIVGKLAAASATETSSKVFKQDFTTIARFNITTLAKAYSTVPDLKAPQLEIGMSVDLQWQAGHTYDIDIE